MELEAIHDILAAHAWRIDYEDECARCSCGRRFAVAFDAIAHVTRAVLAVSPAVTGGQGIRAVCVHESGFEHPSDGSLPCNYPEDVRARMVPTVCAALLEWVQSLPFNGETGWRYIDPESDAANRLIETVTALAAPPALTAAEDETPLTPADRDRGRCARPGHHDPHHMHGQGGRWCDGAADPAPSPAVTAAEDETGGAS